MADKDCCTFDGYGEVEKPKHDLPAKDKKQRATAASAAREWSQISAEVLRARTGPEPATMTNQALLSQVKNDAKSPLAPAYLTWAGDNLMLEARFEEAIEVYREAAKRLDKHRLAETNLLSHVTEQLAVCHQRLGAHDEAVRVYENLIKTAGKSADRASWHMRIGDIAEAAGNDKLAIQAYSSAASVKGTPGFSEGSLQDQAQRAAKYLQSPGPSKATAQELANDLAMALRKGDINALSGLASKTHFSLAIAGSERQFIDGDVLLKSIAADLAVSKVRLDPASLRGTGAKLYLLTHGWNGALLAGPVFMMLTRRRGGWQWDGVALTQLGNAYDSVVPPAQREENQRLRIRIKAPWPAGMCFRAGGVVQFGFIAAGGPLAWWIASLADSCGFGVWGFYYNQSGHSGTDAFAIDFTRNVRGVPWADSSGGVMALSVFEGVVTMVRSFVPSGGTATDNRVEIDHQDPLEVLVALLFGVPIPPPKYRSKYLHLAGPSAILVSPMMSVVQGQRLGPMDDTGLSAVNHLHFSIHDRDLGFASVRPTPMDGQSLGDSESGKCICSTNVPV